MDKLTGQRSDWVDYAKGIGIILVVYGHLLSSAYHAGIQVPEHFFELSDSIVYSFHMPLFFLLAGLFVEGSLQKRGGKDYIFEKFTRIAYPYFVWSVVQVSIEVMFSSQTQLGATVKDVLAIPYKPWGQFWFLYALLIMHFVHVIFSKFGRFSTALMVFTGIGLFFNPFSTGRFALFGFSTHFLFFVIGIVLRKYLANLEKRNISLPVVLILLAGFIGSAYYAFEYAIEPARLAGNPHKFYFLFLSILGIAAVTAFTMYVVKINGLQLLKTLGNYSLSIYLVHMLAGVGFRVVLLDPFNVQNWIIHVLAGVTFALTAPIILQKLLIRINFPYLFELRKMTVRSPIEGQGGQDVRMSKQ